MGDIRKAGVEILDNGQASMAKAASAVKRKSIFEQQEQKKGRVDELDK